MVQESVTRFQKVASEYTQGPSNRIYTRGSSIRVSFTVVEFHSLHDPYRTILAVGARAVLNI